MVVSIPQTILAEMELFEGDRVLIEALPPHRLVITKEMQSMPRTTIVPTMSVRRGDIYGSGEVFRYEVHGLQEGAAAWITNSHGSWRITRSEGDGPIYEWGEAHSTPEKALNALQRELASAHVAGTLAKRLQYQWEEVDTPPGIVITSSKGGCARYSWQDLDQIIAFVEQQNGPVPLWKASKEPNTLEHYLLRRGLRPLSGCVADFLVSKRRLVKITTEKGHIAVIGI
jgi:hypothetical protein